MANEPIYFDKVPVVLAASFTQGPFKIHWGCLKEQDCLLVAIWQRQGAKFLRPVSAQFVRENVDPRVLVPVPKYRLAKTDTELDEALAKLL